MVVTNHPLVSVAILTWNRREKVLRALESVFSQPYRPIEVVVVDSASTDGTCEAIRESFPDVRVIRLHRNLGCPEGRNVALANCNGEVIFSLDDDAWLAPSTISQCVERFSRDRRLGIITCRVVSPGGAPPEDIPEHHTASFRGGACAIRRQVLDDVGYFASDFFRQAEEVDLAIRIIEAGYALLYYPSAIVYHEPTTGTRKQVQVLYYSCRNQLYTVIRRYPWFCVPAGFVWKCVVWNWYGVRMRVPYATIAATIVAMVRAPLLALQRRPVSLATMQRLWELRVQQRRFRGLGPRGNTAEGSGSPGPVR